MSVVFHVINLFIACSHSFVSGEYFYKRLQVASTMPAPYSADLRWRAIWLAEFLSIDKAEVAFYLGMSTRTLERYVASFYRTADVVSLKVGRPYGCVEFHPHEQLFIMEEILSNPDKTLAEIAQDLCSETGSEFSISAINAYLARNGITRKKVL